MVKPAKEALTEAVLTHFLAGGRLDESLRATAAAVGVGHSLLLYHYGSRARLLTEVHLACERRERAHLAALRVRSDAAVTVANGADNIAVYTPLFRTIGAGPAAVTIAVFAAGTAVLCLAGSW